MERELPILEIQGTKFIVDVANDRLKQLDNPENTIWFPHMTDMATHYVLSYDLDKKTRLPYSTDTKVEVNIPTLISLDPQGMAETYGLEIKELYGKTDYQVIVNPQNLQIRLSGKLPEIEIAGDIFIINMEQSELQLKSDPKIKIHLADFDSDGNKDILEAFYDLRTKALVGIDSRITELPADVIKIEIPDELRLDPVYAGQEFNTDLKSFLRNKPLILQQKATVIPLEKTFLMDIVTNNLADQQKEKKVSSQKPDQIPGKEKENAKTNENTRKKGIKR